MAAPLSISLNMPSPRPLLSCCKPTCHEHGPVLNPNAAFPLRTLCPDGETRLLEAQVDRSTDLLLPWQEPGARSQEPAASSQPSPTLRTGSEGMLAPGAGTVDILAG